MKKAKFLKTISVLVFLVVLSACDRSISADYRRERSSARYQEAMADFKAGRIDQAVKGFRAVCRTDPANASARFQLACLLQDSGRDYLGALCAYREFQDQQPDSDKSGMARERAAMCELEVAKLLAEKHGLTDNKRMLQEIEDLRKQVKDQEKRNAKLLDDVSTAMLRVKHLLSENAKIKAALKGDSEEVNTVVAAGLKDAKALLDEDDDDRFKVPEEAKRLKRETEEPETMDRVKLSSDVAALRRESDADESLAHSSLLPKHAPNAVRKEFKKAEPPARPPEPPHEKRPSEYVVQEGDTLYKIANRFYGRTSAWKLIRDANKAVISTDGRVMKDMKIKLPEPR